MGDVWYVEGLPLNEREVFIEALRIPADARAAFLDEACGTSSELRAHIEALLSEERNLEGFLETSVFAAATGSPFSPGQFIGRYRLIHEIADGGMGTVYLAEQDRPFRRQVAIKVVKVGLASRQLVDRFEIERRALAMMDHPNIARVLDGGTTLTGAPYLVMDFIDGQSITQFCDKNQLNPRERLRLVVDVCRALQHAHQKGIVHRDLKPSNILVTVIDGRPVPKVIDFGVAKVIDQESLGHSTTRFGQIVGTLEYMSPEQARRGDDIDTRTDIYALGALAYELLTGDTPIHARLSSDAGYAEAIQALCEVEPIRPSIRRSQANRSPRNSGSSSSWRGDFERQLRDELDWIVMKCLEKDRSRRYETVEALARDIERYLENEPVEARPPSNVYLIKKFVRRHSTAVSSLVTVVVVFIAGIIISSTLAVRAMRAESDLSKESIRVREERDRALDAEEIAETSQRNAERAWQAEAQERKNAVQASEIARRQSYAAQINLAFQAWQDGNVARAAVHLEGLRPRFDEPDLRTFEWYCLFRKCYAGLVARWQGERGQVFGLAFLNDGQTLVTSGWDGAHVWRIDPQAESAELVTRMGTGNTWAVAVSPDQTTLASGSTASDPISVYYWNLRTGVTDQRPKGTIAAIRGLSYSPDGHWLAGVGAAGLTVWNTVSGKSHDGLQSVSSRAVAFSPCEDIFATGSDDGVVRVWQVGGDRFEPLFELRDHKDSVKSLSFSLDGNLLASSSREVNIWDVRTGTKVSTVLSGTSVISSVDFSPTAPLLAIAGDDRTVHVWDVVNEKFVETYAHPIPVSVTKFSPDGQKLASATHDGSIHLWDRTQATSDSLIRHGGEITNSRMLSSERLLTAGEGHARVWRLPSKDAEGAQIDSWTGRDTQLSSDRSIIATLDAGDVQIRDASSLSPITTVSVATDATRIELHSGADRLAAWNPFVPPSIVNLYSISSRTRMFTVDSPSNDFTGVPCVEFSADGKRLAIGYQLWFAVVRESETNAQKLLITHDRSRLVTITAAAFAFDGETLATGTSAGAIRIWKVNSGEPILTLRGHTAAIRKIIFSSDGETIASASDDATVRLWDATAGSERVTLTGHGGPVNCVDFNDEMTSLVTGGKDGTARIWRTDNSLMAHSMRSELNSDDPGCATGIRYLAWEADLSGDHRKSGELYERADHRIRSLIEKFPSDRSFRWERSIGRRSWSNLLMRMKQYSAAEQLIRETIQADGEEFGSDHIMIGRDLSILGECLCRQGRFEQAQSILAESLRIRHVCEPDISSTYQVEYWFGLTHVGLRQFEKGEVVLRTARAGLLRRSHIGSQTLKVIAEFDQFTRELYESLDETQRLPQWDDPTSK